MTKDDKDLGENGEEDIETGNVEDFRDIAESQVENQLQGGDDLSNNSFGSDDGNATPL